MTGEVPMETDLRTRVVALEQWRIQRDIQAARHDERWLHMEQRLGAIEKDIGGIQDTLTWIMRIVIGGILLGIVTFLIKGGFSP